MNLVIVESPSKAKKIEKYLGKGWRVVASYGHVRDLPRKALGVNVENGFTPTYKIGYCPSSALMDLVGLAHN